MWIEVKISEKKCFIFCKINEENYMECVLYDGQESWLERQPMDVILQRAKELNRRVEFDEKSILETLQSGNPTQASWFLGDTYNKRNLKLKYRVHECPLNFNWNLDRQTEKDKFILLPLFQIVHGLSLQNEELCDVVRRKDLEIKQYKIEGAVLKRKTVETPEFNFEQWDKKNAESKALLKSIMQISELIKAQLEVPKSPSKLEVPKSPSKECNVQKPTDENGESRGKNNDVRLTPRRRRRKMLEDQQRIIADKLKARGKPLEYESSQSEQMSGNSQEISDADRSSKTRASVEEKSEDNAKTDVKEETIQTTPSKCLRKRKANIFLEYENSGSSSDEREEKDPTPTKLKAEATRCVPAAKSKLNSSQDKSSDQHSDEIQNLLDEWKALEKRRVADLNNTRQTRTNKRISF